MSECPINYIIGVVADIRRDQENDFSCTKTCVFGIDAKEHEALKRIADVAPKIFTNGEQCDQMMK